MDTVLIPTVQREDLPIPKFRTIVASSQIHLPQSVGTPTTSLASSTNKSSNTAPHSPDGQSALEPPSSPISAKPLIVHRQQSTPISTSPIRTRTSKLFGEDAEDPWGSPAMHQGHNHDDQPVNAVSPPRDNDASGVDQESPPVEKNPPFDYTPSTSTRPTESMGPSGSLSRNSTAFTPRSHEPPQPRNQIEDEHEPDDIHSALRHNSANRTSASSAWGVYDGSTNQRNSFGETGGYNPSVFSEPSVPGMGPRHGSFGGLGGIPNSIHGGGPTVPRNDMGGNSGIPSRGPEEVVTVSVLPEKEGMFMFQHRNYQIASTRRGSRVVRRYSDFVW